MSGSAVEGEFPHICIMGGCYQIVVCTPSSVVVVGVANFLEVFSQISDVLHYDLNYTPVKVV